MPNAWDVANANRLKEQNLCSCGSNVNDHVERLDDLKLPGAIKCKLTKAEVFPYHIGPFQQNATAVG